MHFTVSAGVSLCCPRVISVGPGWKGTPFPASPPPYTTQWVLGGGALGPSLLPNHTGFRPGGLEMGDGCSDGCGSGLRDPSWLVCRGSHGKLLNDPLKAIKARQHLMDTPWYFHDPMIFHGHENIMILVQ